MKQIQDLIAELAKNNSDEQGAISGYFKLLALIKENNLSYELYKDIEEIISDEMNHSQKLSNWATKLSGIYPAKV